MKNAQNTSKRRRPPAISAEAREKQLIALAVDKVEERMMNGTATASEYVHFLKLASTKEQLELEKLRQENEVLKAKTEVMKSMKRSEAAYEEALNAFKLYNGTLNNGDSDE